MEPWGRAVALRNGTVSPPKSGVMVRTPMPELPTPVDPFLEFGRKRIDPRSENFDR